MAYPLVSVIVPNYNHARFLPERMESILGQTYQNFEVIILDDCSSDNSREVIEQYRDNPHVSKIVYNEVNTGKPFVQWRKGIEMAKGELVWIAESDDSCDKKFLERLVADYVKNDCVIAFCRLINMFEDGSFGKTGQGNLWTNGEVGCWTGKDFIKKYLCNENTITNASGCIFKREIALEIDLVYMNYRGVGDWLFWIFIAEHGNVCFDYHTMNFFRQHENNTTSKMMSSGVEFIEIYAVVQYLCKKNLMSRSEFRRLQTHKIYQILTYPFDSEQDRKNALKTWHYNTIIKLRVFLLKLLGWLSLKI